MNTTGHVAVARLLSSDPRVWLGAALPDLAAMGRFRLMGTSPDRSLQHGIVIHHRTDEAFHAHPWFRSRQDRLHDRLISAHGIARGPARAVAHVGPELLLDGALLRSAGSAALGRSVDAAVATIPSCMDALRPLVIRRVEEWPDHLDDITGWSRPSDHHDPTSVARRLERILRRRPRLRLDPGHIEAVAIELTALNDEIGRTADELVDDLAERVSVLIEG